MGFLQGSTNSSGTGSNDYLYVGKTFGRLGQGMESMPDNTKAFLWAKDKRAVAQSYMVVSIFPYDNSFNQDNTKGHRIDLGFK